MTTTMTRQTAKNTYTYTNGLLTRIVHNDTSTSKSETYNIVYNVCGRISTIAVGTQTLITYEYFNNGAGSLTKTTYCNADYETYTYDVWGNMIKQYSGTTLKYEYTCDVSGSIVTVIDYETGRTKKQLYATNGEFVGTAVVDDQAKTILMLTEEDTYKIGTEIFDFNGE